MEDKMKNSILSKSASIWLALLYLIVFTIVLVVVDELVRSFDEGGATAIILFGFSSAIACFFIIKKNPKSIWYVPLIINSLTIISASIEPFFWKLPPDASGIPMWIPACIGWILTLIFSIIAAIKGRKATNFDNSKNPIKLHSGKE